MTVYVRTPRSFWADAKELDYYLARIGILIVLYHHKIRENPNGYVFADCSAFVNGLAN